MLAKVRGRWNKQLREELRAVLVLGVGRRAQILQSAMAAQPELLQASRCRVVGYVETGRDARIVQQGVLQLRISLMAFVAQHGIQTVVIALDDRRQALPWSQLVGLHTTGVHLVEAETFFEDLFGMVYAPWIETGRWLLQDPAQVTQGLSVRHKGEGTGALCDPKRLFDKLSALLWASLSGLPALLWAGWVYGSGRTLAYPIWQYTTVRNGQQTCIVIFQWNAPAFLRYWPYCWHLWKGDLSWIGPSWGRPIARSEAAGNLPQWAHQVIAQSVLTCAPGIFHYTGALSAEQATLVGLTAYQRQLGQDLYYVKQLRGGQGWRFHYRVLFASIRAGMAALWAWFIMKDKPNSPSMGSVK